MAKRRTVKTYLEKNYLIYIIALCIFATAVFLGAIKSSHLTENETAELLRITDRLFNGTYTADYPMIIKQSAFSSLKIVLASLFFSLSVVTSFLSYGIVIVNGFSVGFTSGFIISQYHTKGFLYILSTVVLRSIVYVPLMIILCSICINFAISRKNKRENSLKFFAIMLIIFIIFTVINILDGIFSSFIIKGL